jgi:transposase
LRSGYQPERQVRVYVYGVPCDMRKSFDGRIALVKNAMGKDPLSSHLYVFVNRRRNLLKSIYWDRSGFCIWSKKLEQGNIISNWNLEREREMDYRQLTLVLEGIEKKSQKKNDISCVYRLQLPPLMMYIFQTDFGNRSK